MNDLTILHLSDLHIDGQAAYPEILKNLLVHIKEEIATTREKTLVVAVTGDIIDKGNKAAIDNAKKFFEDLKKTLGNKVAGIVLVPGNHDIFRSNSCKFIIPACRTFAVQKEYEFGNTFMIHSGKIFRKHMKVLDIWNSLSTFIICLRWILKRKL